MKKILCLIMSLFMCVSTILFGSCKETSQTVDEGTVSDIPSSVSATHYTNRQEKEGYLANNGTTEYKVVYPAEARNDLQLAVDDFIDLFEESTGAKLSKTVDTETTWDETKKYISLGQTTLLEQAGIEVDWEVLKSNGTRAVTKGNTIFVFGAEDKGCVNAVYKFLESLIGFDRYGVDCYGIEKHPQLKMYDYDMLEVPDFEFRIPNTGYAKLTGEMVRQQYWDESELMRRLRVVNPDTDETSISHTSFTFCSPTLHNNPDDSENYHPDWFSDDRKQLCYTAHGDKDEWNAMIEQMAKVAIHSIKVEKDVQSGGTVMFFYIQDNGYKCSCAACIKQAEEDGSISGAIVRVANAVMKIVNAWWETEEGQEYSIPGFTLAIGAYNDFSLAPIKKNAEGKYEATITAEKGVGVMYAPSAMWYTQTFDGERNLPYKTALEGWGMVTDTVLYWMYSTNFVRYLVPYNVFGSMQSIFQECKKYGGTWMYWQSQHNNRGWLTGWNIYKNYLESKLLWNVNINTKYYEDKFFENYFGEASEIMHDLFASYRARATLNEENGYEGDVNNTEISRNKNTNFEFWPIGLLEDWLDDFDKAFEKIEHLKEFDRTNYDMYHKRILAERVWLYYIGVESHGDALGSERLLSWKLSFKEGATLLGITRYAESNDVLQLYASWGI